MSEPTYPYVHEVSIQPRHFDGVETWVAHVRIAVGKYRTRVVTHGPFLSQWEAGQFASTVKHDTPVEK